MMRDNHSTVDDVIHTVNLVFETTNEKASAAVAATMISVPLWKQWLSGVSEIAALVAPLLGCFFLVLQIVIKLWELSSNKK
jgi:hypothetical protein